MIGKNVGRSRGATKRQKALGHGSSGCGCAFLAEGEGKGYQQ
jgi:hypothetical protein